MIYNKKGKNSGVAKSNLCNFRHANEDNSKTISVSNQLYSTVYLRKCVLINLKFVIVFTSLMPTNLYSILSPAFKITGINYA